MLAMHDALNAKLRLVAEVGLLKMPAACGLFLVYRICY